MEVTLIAANVLGVVLLVLRRPGRTRWLLAVPAVAAVQILAEGPRWQMVPAYAVAVAVPAAATLRPRTGRPARLGAGAVGLVVLAASVALPVLVPVFRFPAPTGPYGIGTVTYHWVDATRPEPFTAAPDDHREIMAQVWYPATPAAGDTRAPYLEDADAVTPVLGRLTGLPSFLLRHFRYVTTNAVEGAPVAGRTEAYPVLVFVSGLYGFRSVSTFQIQELVSRGYVVVGLDQPGVVATVRFPDGHQVDNLPFEKMDPLVDQSVEARPAAPELNGVPRPAGLVPFFAEDVRLTLDRLALVNAGDPYHRLAGRLDLDRTGVFGVSLGGRIAAESCLRDSRLKACLVMDDPVPAGVAAAGLRQPTMFLTRDAATMRLERERSGGWSEHDIAVTLGAMRTAFTKLSGGGYYVEIPGLFHVNFTDLPYWLPPSEQFGLSGPIGGRRGFAVVNAYTTAFFDEALRGRTSPVLSEPIRGTVVETRGRSH
ncbi:alpha/beta hydrolase family protein [Actinoplanes sp. NPDC049265]|uniref:alpha/beta hydrolase family protein n=1 Tax=Actinoplanes sp. NPDC049265 TaxID=3363902 RepID=UPI00371D09E0